MHPLFDNPFFVLELPPTATPLEVERQGRKLLGMLDLGLPQAQTYATPRGPRGRTADGVRVAVQILLDPVRRLPFEPWAAAEVPRNDASRDGAADVVVNREPGDARAVHDDDGVNARGMTWWQR
jgi:hypothetical protein